MKLVNEVKKLKLEVNKHKASTEIYKHKVDLLHALLEDKTHHHEKGNECSDHLYRRGDSLGQPISEMWRGHIFRGGKDHLGSQKVAQVS